ncbi:sugar-phosphatase [Liquorilactobacillus capillatus]|uniref:HAD superfamily hydrolase n=1 Tax=Liquorilactobacillus capillatus DSM 19910 TaxID=1423731 RepID=A0A0R1MBU7_9LACO|nr:sugar-phosphatase [Liquorilactobacillus capillatus]KRL02394.1 HAD superfamily hydrolase [Liquorilactobacillus capillatus DSM 19910]
MIALDIDDTLVNSEKKLTNSVKHAIKKAKAAEIKVVLCTGRPLSGVVSLLKELDLADLQDQYVVSFGGSLVQTTSGTVISATPLSYDSYLDLECLARKKQLHFHAISNDRIYTANRDIGEYTIHESSLVSLNVSYRTPDEMRGVKIIKAMFIDQPEILEGALKDYTGFAKLEDRVTFTRSTPYFYEANAKGISKASALQQLCQKLSLTADNVMAIGDGGNDLSMIKFAGLGVAMKNAIPELKKVAQAITADNNHSGVAAAIEKYVLH